MQSRTYSLVDIYNRGLENEPLFSGLLKPRAAAWVHPAGQLDVHGVDGTNGRFYTVRWQTEEGAEVYVILGPCQVRELADRIAFALADEHARDEEKQTGKVPF